MSEKESAPPDALSRQDIAERLASNFEKLPEAERNLFTYGPVFLAGNGALSGVIANTLYRRALNVTQAVVASSLPMAVLPFMTTLGLYNAAVSVPLLSGELNCPTCVLTRGALVGLLGAGLYPIFLALPVNVGLAVRYSTAPQPVKGNTLRYWTELSRPILRRMRLVLSVQLLFGTYLSSQHFAAYTKLLALTLRDDSEELKD